MLKLSQILNFEFNSALIRYLLSFYYKPGRHYKIPLGCLKGLRLWYDRSVNFHAVLGLWEKDNFDFLNKLLTQLSNRKSRIVAYDVGANIGLFSLFLSTLQSKVKGVAFEPVPETFNSLKKNLAINSIENVVAVQGAASANDGEAIFFVGHHHKSSLSRDWASDRGTSEIREIKVTAISLDNFLARHQDLQPDFIKIDVEGGGDSVLKGCTAILSVNRPLLLFESHTPKEDQAVITVLNDFNYRAFRINNKKWVVNMNKDYTDPEGVWGTMLLFPEEKVSEFSFT